VIVSSLNVSGCVRAGLILVASLLASCGGGGGGGDDNDNGNNTLTLNASSVSCANFQNDFNPVSQDVRVSWTSSRVDGFVVGTLPGVALPPWLSAEVIGTSSPLTVRLYCTSIGQAPGRYTITLRFITGTESQQILGQRDVPVTFDVVPEPTVAPVAMDWVETEGPAASSITVTRASGVTISGVSSDVPWASATLVGDTITLTGTGTSASQAPGDYLGNLHTTFTLGSRTRVVASPLSATVTQALTGPLSLSFVIDANTTADDLAGRTATVATATAAPITFSVQGDVPWLSVTGNATGAADNLSLALVSNQLPQLPFGVSSGTLIVTPANGATPLQIPVTLDVRLPEVHFVAPVAFTDTLDTDYVIVRGGGFTSPGFQLRIDGAVTDAEVISDDEIRLVPGQRTVGDHPVGATNALGFVRDSAPLRIADPPPYQDALLPADVGPQTRVVSSPINGVVFSSRAYFTDSYKIPPAGNASVIQRFAYQAGTWTRTEHVYPQLFDFALSPDESLLIVLTSSDLRIVDPESMQTLDTYALSRSPGGFAKELGVLNNGLVLLGDTRLVFSLRTRTWVDFPFYDSHGGIMASLDGSRALLGISGSPYSFIDASTNTIVIPDINQTFFCCGAISRHGTVALINHSVLDVDGDVRGVLPTTGFLGDLSPDGRRAYGHDHISGALRSFDLTTSPLFTELTPIPYPLQIAGETGLIAVDPAGGVVFKITEQYFVVTRLP
jgi:hypothetical protein